MRLPGSFKAAGSVAPRSQACCAATERRLRGRDAQATGVAERCNNRDYHGDSVLAVQCLQYAMGVGMTRGGQGVVAPQFKISRFEKLGCEKAQGEAGFRCDYMAGRQHEPAAVTELGCEERQCDQARLVKRSSGWSMLADRAR